MDKKGITVEEKLRALYDLQIIDSKIDEIIRTRGELPLEVQDIKDNIEGKKVKISHLDEDITTLESNVSNAKNAIKEADTFVKKYTEQQKSVRNSREYNSINKEIEFQKLEIELSEKKINDLGTQIELKKTTLEEEQNLLTDLDQRQKEKEKELKVILAETEKQEKDLLNKSKELESLIEERLLRTYKRLRKNLKNGLAVVPIKKGASAGSFFSIPPQMQIEIASRKKIVTDEHSGRILVDLALAEEEEDKFSKLF